jgi:hypothetical protein
VAIWCSQATPLIPNQAGVIIVHPCACAPPPQTQPIIQPIFPEVIAHLSVRQDSPLVVGGCLGFFGNEAVLAGSMVRQTSIPVCPNRIPAL